MYDAHSRLIGDNNFHSGHGLEQKGGEFPNSLFGRHLPPVGCPLPPLALPPK
jgi:hypothetical protein